MIKKATRTLGSAVLALGMMQIPAFAHGGGGHHGGGHHGGGQHGGGYHGCGHHGGNYHGHYHGHSTVVVTDYDDHHHNAGAAFLGAMVGAGVGTAIANSNNPASD